MMTKTYGIIGIILALICICVSPAIALTTTTYPVDLNVSMNCVYFYGGYSNGTPANVWFEFGLTHADNGGHKSYKTPNKTATTPNFTAYQCGIPLMTDNTYTVQAVSDYVYGDNVSFTMPSRVEHAGSSNYINMVDKFASDGWNPIELITVDVWQVYAMNVGISLFFGCLLGFAFINMAIKQKSVTVVIITMFITGFTLLAVLPPEFQKVAYGLIVCAIAGILYYIFMKRR